MNTQVLCNKCSETVKMNYCVHCNYKSTRMWCVKRHIESKHAPILNQEDVGEDIAEGRVNTPFTEQDEVVVKDEDIAGGRVNTPFTELNELHVKDEVKDPELLEDSITRKCEENTINVDELTKMFESMTLK